MEDDDDDILSFDFRSSSSPADKHKCTPGPSGGGNVQNESQNEPGTSQNTNDDYSRDLKLVDSQESVSNENNSNSHNSDEAADGDDNRNKKRTATKKAKIDVKEDDPDLLAFGESSNYETCDIRWAEAPFTNSKESYWPIRVHETVQELGMRRMGELMSADLWPLEPGEILFSYINKKVGSKTPEWQYGTNLLENTLEFDSNDKNLRKILEKQDKKSSSRFWKVKANRKSYADAVEIASNLFEIAKKRELKKAEMEKNSAPIPAASESKDDGNTSDSSSDDDDYFIASQISVSHVNQSQNKKLPVESLFPGDKIVYRDSLQKQDVVARVLEVRKRAALYPLKLDTNAALRKTTLVRRCWDGRRMQPLEQKRNLYGYREIQQFHLKPGKTDDCDEADRNTILANKIKDNMQKMAKQNPFYAGLIHGGNKKQKTK